MSGSAKEIELRPITRGVADRFVRRHHYSGRVVRNSQVHIGAFLGGQLGGVLQLGPSMDKRRVARLVRGTGLHEFLELNRLAFSDVLPRNSESRAIAVTMRLIRKHVPQVKWVISFADATQCGDGTIYRAAGFLLTGIKRNRQILELPDGRTIAKLTVESSPLRPRPELDGQSLADIAHGSSSIRAYMAYTGARFLEGFQLRYVRFVDPTWRPRLTVRPLPYSAIGEAGACMYRGERAGSIDSDASADQAGEGGAGPTPALTSCEELPR